jgi:serine/threonine-protein kinase
MESHQLLQPAAPQEDSRIGMVLQDRYKIIRKLGEGGMGAVYEGEHVLIKRRVAIKCLHSQYATSGDIDARYHREAHAATSIGNEHIIEVTDMGRFPDGSVFMVLEFLAGHDLSHEIEGKGPLPLGRVMHICAQVCEALGAAHEKGIVHRDLKPENVIVGEQTKVLDFGISKFKDSGDGQNYSMTRTGMAMGTPYYMAPEQAHGHKDLDHRTDIYALGVMMFRALTGQLPFDDESYPMLILKICTQPPPSIRQLRPDLPPEVEGIVNRLLAKDKNERFPDCASVRAAILPFRGVNSAPVMGSGPASGEIAPMTPVLGTNAVKPAPVASATPSTTGPMTLGPSTQSTPSLSVAATGNTSSRMGLVLGGLGVVVLLGAGVVVTMRKTDTPTAPPGVTQTASTNNNPPSTSGPTTPANNTANAQPTNPGAGNSGSTRTVRVQISTNPAGAEIYLDGARIANPFDADLPSSNEPHRLEARMPGYVTNIQDLSLMFGQRVVLQLRHGSGTEDHRAARTAGGATNAGSGSVIDPSSLNAAQARETPPATNTANTPAAPTRENPPAQSAASNENTGHAESHHDPAPTRPAQSAPANPPPAAEPPPPTNPAVVTPPTTQPLRRRAF